MTKLIINSKGNPPQKVEFTQGELVWRENEEQAWLLERNQAVLNEIRLKRRMAYQEESDPLFFNWQAGEGTKEAWLEKINEIKQRYPKNG